MNAQLYSAIKSGEKYSIRCVSWTPAVALAKHLAGLKNCSKAWQSREQSL